MAFLKIILSSSYGSFQDFFLEWHDSDRANVWRSLRLHRIKYIYYPKKETVVIIHYSIMYTIADTLHNWRGSIL